MTARLISRETLYTGAEKATVFSFCGNFSDLKTFSFISSREATVLTYFCIVPFNGSLMEVEILWMNLFRSRDLKDP
jgi:hypothetical protein